MAAASAFNELEETCLRRELSLVTITPSLLFFVCLSETVGRNIHPDNSSSYPCF